MALGGQRLSYLLHLLVYFDIYVIVALSLNLVVGYCGLLSLAHAGFYAIGGYAYATLAVARGIGFLPAVVVGAVLAALLSLSVSLASWRLKGDFFVLASLAFQTFIFTALNSWSGAAALGSWRNLTNGPLGITGISRPSLFGFLLVGDIAFAGFATVTAAVCAFLLWRLAGSPWGRLLVSMRDDDLAARGIGKNTRLARVQALAVSAAVAAVGGAVYAAHVQYLDPSAASLDNSILMLSLVIVGGLGNFKGPIAGAVTLIGLPEVLRLFRFPDAQAANLRLGIYGLLLILFMHFRPQGIAGKYRLE
jgi:branched-chain amino acid transport system permease protein